MQANVETQISIAAKPTEVFKYLSHLKYHYLWNPQLRHISSMGVLKLGSTYTTESQVLGMNLEASNIITEFDSPWRLAMENKLGTVQYRADFRLRTQGEKTLVKLVIILSADNKQRLFTVPILKQLARRELRTDLQALKVAVENKLT